MTGSTDREIVIHRELAARRELVWAAMTSPAHLMHWWGPRGFTTTIETMEFRAGGVWRLVMHGPDGTNYPNQHLLEEIVPPECIVFTIGGGREGGSAVRFRQTWTFEVVPPERTRATIRMEFPTAEERDFVVKEFGALEGGRQTLERLEEYVLKHRPEEV